MVLAVHDRGVDVAGYRLTTPASSTGYKFVSRYSAGAASNPAHPSYDAVKWKLCQSGEIARLVALGYDVMANSEWTVDRITEGGTAGALDGAEDLKFWKSMGLHAGASIYVSWDTKSDTAHYGNVRAYLEAYQRALGDYYHVDMYADDHALREFINLKLIRYGWRSMSDSFSNDGSFYAPGSNWLAESEKVAAVSPAHLWQDGNRPLNRQADEDVILRLPIGSHLEQTGVVVSKPVAPTNVIPATYKVVSGDTLSKIAARFHIVGGWETLARLNHLSNPNLIRVNQILKLR
jgi:LysM repeat protein